MSRRPEITRLAVKVVPSSSRSCVVGWIGADLKIRVTEPPERGRANAAVEELLADALGLPRSCVRIVAGGSQPRKTVEVHGLAEAELRARLARGAK